MNKFFAFLICISCLLTIIAYDCMLPAYNFNCKKTKKQVYSKDIHKIKKVFDYYKADLTDEEKLACAKVIYDIDKKNNSLNSNEVLAVIKVESRFRRSALSSRGAVGLMQIMPNTYKGLCKRYNLKYEGRKGLLRPTLNVYVGSRYLIDLKKEHIKNKYAYESYNRGAIKKKKVHIFPYYKMIQKAYKEIKSL